MSFRNSRAEKVCGKVQPIHDGNGLNIANKARDDTRIMLHWLLPSGFTAVEILDAQGRNYRIVVASEGRGPYEQSIAGSGAAVTSPCY